jgi:chromate reductase
MSAGVNTRLLFLAGSQRRESFNARLLRDLACRAGRHCEIDIIEPAHVNLPIFDQDIETDPHNIDCAARLLHRVAASDGLVVCSPEYNGQATPYLKNMVDWITRLARIDRRFQNPFTGRPLLLGSASTGRSGGTVAMPHYRALFGYVGATVVGETLCVPNADVLWTPSGYAWSTAFDKRVDACVERIVALAHGFARSRVREVAVSRQDCASHEWTCD